MLKSRVKSLEEIAFDKRPKQQPKAKEEGKPEPPKPSKKRTRAEKRRGGGSWSGGRGSWSGGGRAAASRQDLSQKRGARRFVVALQDGV